MKKLLAMALTLALGLSLAAPALAEEANGAVELMEELGLLETAQPILDDGAVHTDTFVIDGEDLPPEIQEYLREHTADGDPVELTPELYQQLLELTDVDLLPGDWWMGDDLSYSEPEPTLTLMVNGVATDVAVTAVDGVSYADADALRQFFGPQTVPADAAGPQPIRETAQKAGWDVDWFDGGWRGNDQEIQLWDKAGYEAELEEEFGPANGFLAQAMGQSKALIFSETPLSGHETMDIDLTRFSTLDENKTYTLKLGVDYVVQKGVMDVTLTFDLSQLLRIIDPRDLAGMAKEGGFTVAQLTSLLKAGTAELILDYNEGAMAYNIPLLALFDEDEAGWQTVYSGSSYVLPDLDELEDFALVSSLYATMTTTAGYMGAEYAAENYEGTVGMLSVFFGKDHFSTQNGKLTYSMTTQDVNRAVGAVIAQNLEMETVPQVSVFKHCELTYTLDGSGNISMDLHIRPDMEGIRDAIALGDAPYGMATLMGWYLPVMDMDVTAAGQSSRSRATSSMRVHWNNVGTMDMRVSATAGTALAGPRQIEALEPDVER